MKVAVTGATGTIGTAAVRALRESGHHVVGLTSVSERVPQLREAGVEAVVCDLFDHAQLVAAFDGCEAVCSLASHVPVGWRAAWPRSWRHSDRLRTEGVRRVVDAALAARARRLVQASDSSIYADNGDGWITEQSPVEITEATEPASVAESHLQDYQYGPRTGVILRFGAILGDDEVTRWKLRSARHGRPVAVGNPDTWMHPVHTDDLGLAVVAALSAPSGVYNVGAEPVRRQDLAEGFARATGQEKAAFVGPLLRRFAGARTEPLTRSLRVSSEHFTAQAGWTARRPVFDPSWFDVSGSTSRAAL